MSGGAHGDSVWLFSLEGKLEQTVPDAPRPKPDVPVTSGAAVSLEAGKATYGNSCIFCHGPEGTGGHGGPAFAAERSVEQIQRIVSAGGNVMPPFGNTLDASQLANVSAWAFELAQRASKSERSQP